MISPFERRCVPVDLALREAHMKGSVLDRVALLEHRLTEVSPLFFLYHSIRIEFLGFFTMKLLA